MFAIGISSRTLFACVRRRAVICGNKSHISTDFNSLPDHQSLVIGKYGEPNEIVELKIRKPSEVLPERLGPKQVLVTHLAACVNPSDISLIRGIYGIKPNLPAVIGLEGVVRVDEVGEDIHHLKPGSMALGVSLVGYWQSYSVQDGDDLYPIESELEPSVAAQLKVNPCTALRMLRDFVDLKPGDSVIQNGANSAVGIYVIQMAKLAGIKTINVVRNRPNIETLYDELYKFGADLIVSEEQLKKLSFKQNPIKPPRLFLDCVGGQNHIDCVRHLAQRGQVVVYGAMSRQPHTMSSSSLIFKDCTQRGFWMSRWYKERAGKDRRVEIQAMLNEVAGMFHRGELRSKNTSSIGFQSRNLAFESSSNSKFIFNIN